MDKFFQMGPLPADQLIGVYNIKLVLLSYIIAIFASYVALDITARLKEEENTRANNAWLLGGAFVMGAGIWSMHFIGMLAFSFPQLGREMSFTGFWTILSFITAIIASGFVLISFQITNAKFTSLIIASILLGVAISSMHYTGMEGIRDFVNIHYLPGLFILSLLIAIVASGAALWLVSKNSYVIDSSRYFSLKFGSAFILGSAICAMHYTGMAAAIFTPSHSRVGTIQVVLSFDQTKLAIYITGTIVLILGIALVLSHYERARYKVKFGKEMSIKTEMLKLYEEKLRLILEACADGIVMINARYEIEICSASFYRFLHCTSKELVGKKITQFLKISNGQHESKNAFYELFSQPEKDKLYEVQGIRRDGHLIPLELAISTIQFSSSLFTICSLREISDRKKTEQLIELRHEVMHLLAESLSLNASIHSILKKLCERMDWVVGIFWKLDAQRDVLHCADTWSVNDEKYKNLIKLKKGYAFQIHIGLPGRVLASKKFGFSLIIEDDNNFPWKQVALDNGLQSAIAFPIMNKNVLIGIIECFSDYRLDYSYAVAQWLQNMGEEIGIIVEREDAHKNLTVARQVGMAEVANSVLHNIGNVLNSVNVSVNLLLESTEMSYLKKLSKAIELLRAKVANLDPCIDEESEIWKIIDYLAKVIVFIERSEKNSRKELKSLYKNIEHIKAIITSQQAFSGASGLVEMIDLTTIIESALKLYMDPLAQGKIDVIRQYESIKPCMVDCVKLMQILVNLIDNAKDALLSTHTKKKQLTIRLTLLADDIVEIRVIDNGCGIDPEDLPEIFSYGFTTKKDGHGFGLHSSLIAAEEMEASLSVESDGLGMGASFILKIPYKRS